MKYSIILYLVFFISCNQYSTHDLSLDEIFNSKFEHSLISRGSNFPDFQTRKDSIDLFLVSLHYNIAPMNFQKKAGWTDEFLQAKIDFLLSKNWLLNKDGLKPTIFIASHAEGLKLLDLAKPIANMIAASIKKEIPEIKKKYLTTELSKNKNFSTMSFLILSNVLLDNWQINQVEKDFLQKDQRPERHGRYYYYSIIQNPDYPKEKFGIYGNKFGRLGDTTSYSVYGNNRITLLKKFNANPIFRDSLINNAPMVNSDDDLIFREMADMYLPKLLSILNENRAYMTKVYHNTGYADKISFEEFFIWWYHLIYTDATNILSLNGDIIIPEDGNFFYLTQY